MKYFKQFHPEYCIADNELKQSLTKHYEGVFTQGSGYLHIRGSYEEGLIAAPQNEEYMRIPANVTIEKPYHPRSKIGTYIPGITGIHPLLKEELVNLPNLLSFRVTANQIPLDMDNCNIKNYKRYLDMQDGVLYREFDWIIDEKTTISCFFRRYVSQDMKHLVVQKMTFSLKGNHCMLFLQNDIDTNVKTNGFNHYKKIDKTKSSNQVNVEICTDNEDLIKMSSRVFGASLRSNTLDLTLENNDCITINKLSFCLTSRDLDSPRSFEDISKMLDHAQNNIDKLYEKSEKVWQQLWENSRVTIEGDDVAQRAVNFSIYHMLRAANTEDSRIAICAKGFAGEAYFGHFFWDTEVYLLPFFLYTNPNIAKKLVEFRIGTLEGAKINAKNYGYNGARYPWESSVSGEEQCPNWQYADNEVHITADVTLGLWHYYKATKDLVFLFSAAPVFVETANYWLSRVEYKADGSIKLNGVMGPDEYICFCNNNAYTNYMVSKSLKYTLEVLDIINKNNIELYKTLNVTKEQKVLITTVAQGLKIQTKENGIIPQCDDFENFEEPHFDKVWLDRKKPFGNFISQEKNYRVKALKQADVLMLPYLFPNSFLKEQIEANYNYYFPYTTHDSSLSCIVHSILCSKIDRVDEAYNLFCKSLDIDLSEEKAGAAEGIHIANCGGIWQGIIFGFAGMSWSYESNVLKFSPKIPKQWKLLSFNIIHNGEKLKVTIDAKNIKVEERIGLTKL